jgi:hypothetical protein
MSIRVTCRHLVLTLGLCLAALTVSCNGSSYGMGIGVRQPGAQWGTGAAGPSVYVGGPSWP